MTGRDDDEDENEDGGGGRGSLPEQVPAALCEDAATSRSRVGGVAIDAVGMVTRGSCSLVSTVTYVQRLQRRTAALLAEKSAFKATAML